MSLTRSDGLQEVHGHGTARRLQDAGPGGQARRQVRGILLQRRWLWPKVMTFASVSRTDFRRRRCLRICRRPQPLEDALLRFVRLKRASIRPGKPEQYLESLFSLCYTRLGLERIHGVPPDVVKPGNTGPVFPGFYLRRRIPCTHKPSSRGTVTPNSFHANSL
jgi:hypothetical protein